MDRRDSLVGNPSHGAPGPSRPYRSKRHRPCDVCRRRKNACYVDQQPPCRNCHELRVECTFNEPPKKRRRQGQRLGQEQEQEQDHGQLPSLPPLQPPSPPAAADAGAGLEAPSLHPRLDSAGEFEDLLADVEDTRSHPLYPGHDDLRYLASLWDPTFTNFELDNTLGDGFNNYLQDNLFGSLDVQEDSEQRSLQPPQPNTNSNVHVRAQPLHSLDVLEKGISAQYLGLSGAVDPFLLRHMRFSDEDIFDFGHFQYRRVAGSSSVTEGQFPEAVEQIPAHFVINGPKQNEDSDPTSPRDRELKLILEKLVTCDLRARLVSLFLRYVFPGLPVLSRSQLKIRTAALIPEDRSLSTIPYYLLAAVYASAEPFCRYDPALCVSQLNTTDKTSTLWNIAYLGIQQNMLKPQLAVLQTILIYLQRTNGRSDSAIADLPGNWPLLGSAVNMAYQLGLHLDCQTWAIPSWERRLRRRLWWVLYSEATWRSLLLGYPNAIPVDEWDVSPLGDQDFAVDHLQCPTEQSALKDPAQQDVCQFCHGGYDFRFLASLSTHASNVHRIMYTLAASRRYSSNFGASLESGERLLANIRDWEKDLPVHMAVESQPNNLESRDYFHPGSATHIKLAFLTVEVLIYKAMLRPLPSITASCNDPRPISESRENIRPLMSSSASWGRYQGPGKHDSEFSAVLETFRGAINIVRRASKFAHRLGSYDRNSLFYSWARNCFAIISNFILLLLVQAPTADLAKEVLTLLPRWVIMLREQCILFDHMQLGLLQLDRVFQLGIQATLSFPQHVLETVQAELPFPIYK